MTQNASRKHTPRHLGAAVELYLAGMDKADRTVRTTRTALNRLVTMTGADLLLREMQADTIIEYRIDLKDGDLSWASVSTYMRLVIPFFRWLILRDWAAYSTEDLDRALEVVKGMNGRKPQPLPKLPDEDVVTKIMRLAEERTTLPGTDRQEMAAMRDAAMLHILRVTGVRVQELVDMKIGDIHLDTPEGEEYAIVTGKGDKQRPVFFDDRALWYLKDWLQNHPHGGPEAPVFIRFDRQAPNYESALGTESVRRLLRILCKELGVKAITPHQFRHRYGTAVYVAAGIGATADLMGHSSTDTTRIYAKLARRQMKAAHHKAAL